MKLEDAVSTVRAVARRRLLASENVALVRAHGRIAAGSIGAGVEQADSSPAAGAGIPMTPLRISQAAATGLASVQVRRRPTVAVFTIGDSVEPGLPVSAGRGYEGSRELLVGLLRADGLEPTAWPQLEADPRRVEIALRDAGCAFDSILVCGAAAALCMVRDVLDRFGSIDVSRAGREDDRSDMLFGLLDEAALLAFPSHPVAIAGLYLTAGRALFDGLQGRSKPRPVWRGTLTGPAGPELFQLTSIEFAQDAVVHVSPLTAAMQAGDDAWHDADAVLVRVDASPVPKLGDMVEVVPLPSL